MNSHPILLVEDNPDDIELTQRAFRRNNLANPLEVATDGEQALQRISPDDGSEPLEPALILLDIKLPRLSGLDVLAKIRAHPRGVHLPVVMLTTSDHETDIARAYDLGANSYVRKPVDFTAFMDTVKTLGLYWLVINIPPPPTPLTRTPNPPGRGSIPRVSDARPRHNLPIAGYRAPP